MQMISYFLIWFSLLQLIPAMLNSYFLLFKALLLLYSLNPTSALLCSQVHPFCETCSSDQTRCERCMLGYFLFPIPGSAPLCVPDCSKFHTHVPNLVSRECVFDCDVICERGQLCGSDKTSCPPPELQNACPEMGYLLKDGSCSLVGCPPGFYREASTRTCEECHSSCSECFGQNGSECLACPQGTFLNQATSSSSTCLTQSSEEPTFELFVTSSPSAQDEDGSLERPFSDLRRALDKANELSAPYSNSTVTIFLFKGDHFILWPPLKISGVQSNYSLLIRPLPCDFSQEVSALCVSNGNSIKIQVKVGAYFSIPAPSSLTLESLDFDFSDSLLQEGSPCLSLPSQTCSVQPDSFDSATVVSLDSDCECQSPLTNGFECASYHPLSFIATHEAKPTRVHISHSSFTNIYSPFNSLVKLTDSLSLSISDSLFQDISMCGAILSNLHTPPYVSPIQKAMSHTSSLPSAQTQLASITLEGSSFQRIGQLLHFPSIHSLRIIIYQNPEATFDSLSPILNVRNFPGQIALRSNEFVFCKLYFDDFLQELHPSQTTETLPSEFAIRKSSLLAQGLIVASNHTHGLLLLQNIFSHNSALRGLVVLTLAPTIKQGALIYGNSFVQNSCAYSASTLNLKAPLLPEDPSSCSGFHLESNTFARNLLSPNSMSVVSVACVQEGFPHSDSVDDVLLSQFVASEDVFPSAGHPESLLFSYQIGTNSTLQVDFHRTVIRDSIFSQNLRTKGDGSMLQIVQMRRVEVSSIQLIRNGDFSLCSFFNTSAQFFEEYGAIHQGVVLPSFEAMREGQHDSLIVVGGVHDLLLKDVQGSQNWFWRTTEGAAHVLEVIRGSVRLEEFNISTLIEGEHPLLMEYLVAPHSFLDRTQIVHSNFGVLSGPILSLGKSTSWKGGSLEKAAVARYFLRAEGEHFQFSNVTFSRVRGYSLNALIPSLELDSCSFSSFVFRMQFAFNSLSIRNSLFSNFDLSDDSINLNILKAQHPHQRAQIIDTAFHYICGTKQGCLLPTFFTTNPAASLTVARVSGEGFIGRPGSNMFANFNGLLQISHSVFSRNHSPNGGVIMTSRRGTTLIAECEFASNSATSGGAFLVDSQSTVSIANSSFLNNSASAFGGVISLSGEITLSFLNCTFEANSAGRHGSVLQGHSKSYELAWNFQNCTFRRNQGLSLINAIGAALTLSQSSFLGNSNALGSSSPLQFLNSRVTIARSLFSNRGYSLACPSDSSRSGGFLYDLTENQIRIESSEFESVCAFSGGAIYLGGFSALSIRNSSFSNCSAASRGGAIYASNFLDWNIEDSVFRNNLGKEGASDIHLQDSQHLLSISNSSFLASKAPSIANYRSALSLNNSTISHSFSSNQSSSHSAVACIECVQLLIQGNTFDHLPQGFEIIQAKRSSNQSFNFTGNVFRHIESEEEGGAIRAIRSAALQIQHNTFEDIVSLGGALFLSHPLEPSVLEANSFFDCRALRGAALLYDAVAPSLLDNTFKGNEASLYGPNMASYPARIGFASFPNQRRIKLSGVRSGSVLDPVEVVLLDRAGQVVSDVSGNTLYASIHLESPQSGPFVGVLRTEYARRWENGTNHFEQTSIVGEPGKTYLVTLSTNHVDLSLPDSAEFLSRTGQLPNSLYLEISLRHCRSGEAFLQNGECRDCPPGSFILNPPRAPQDCLPCPTHATCSGRGNLSPLPGYWRPSLESSSLYECFNSRACVGSSSEPQCAQGYRGRLCASCETGYSRDSLFNCSRCPSEAANVAIVLVLSLFTVVLLIALIKCSLRASLKKKSLFTVYFKILVNHFQVLMLISSFDLEWPAEVAAFLSSSEVVASSPQTLFSVDCFLETSLGKPLKRFYIYLILYSSLPALLALVAFIVLSVRFRCRKAQLQSNFDSSILVLYFLIHPSLTSFFFQAFHCVPLEGESFLRQELSEQCWTGHHLAIGVSCGLLSLLVWSFGIPFSWYLLTRRYRHRLEEPEVKRKFGFLFNGYHSRAYFWEVVVSLRKIVIAFVATFLSVKGSLLQSLVLLVILLLCLAHSARVKPFQHRRANCLELLSLVALLLTAYCGIFFLSARSPSSVAFTSGKDLTLSQAEKWLLFLLIFASNLLFFVVWCEKLVRHFQGSLLRKAPQCFRVCCLLGSRRRLRIAVLSKEIEEDREDNMRVVSQAQERLEQMRSKFSKVSDSEYLTALAQAAEKLLEEVESIEREATFKNKRRLLERKRVQEKGKYEFGEQLQSADSTPRELMSRRSLKLKKGLSSGGMSPNLRRVLENYQDAPNSPSFKGHDVKRAGGVYTSSGFLSKKVVLTS